MKFQVDIPEAVFEKYLTQAKDRPIELELADRLKRFADVPVDDRAIVIFGDERRKLEAAVQTTVANFDELYKHFVNMGSVRIGSVTRVFTASELIRLRDQAIFHGWTPEKYMELTANEALDYCFNRM